MTRFYPLAGRARENSYIQCNDDGAEYVEARANSVLADFLKEPTPELLACFLPIKTEAPEAADGGRMFLVQVFSSSLLTHIVCFSKLRSRFQNVLHGSISVWPE